MPKQKPVLNQAGTHVWLHNPATGGTWECPLDVASTFRGRGWVNTDAPDTSLDGLFDDSTAEGPNQTGFDPHAHHVDEINEHLEEAYAAGALGEVERVLALEAAGQGRVTVVDPRPTPDVDTDGTTGD